MEQLKSMKTQLIAQAQSQMGNLANVDAKEMGEVVDMIKDLEEAIYYCTITKAMEDSKKDEQKWYGSRYPYEIYRDMDAERMYYSGGRSGGSRSNPGTMTGMRRYDSEYDMPYEVSYDSMPMRIRDSREGRSPIKRKYYMESKEAHHGKEKKMKELEEYMQELGKDITEMIEDASTEEKQILHQKLVTLANKINV